MRTFCIFMLLSSYALAEIDPGCVADFRAAFGRNPTNDAEVIAWDNVRQSYRDESKSIRFLGSAGPAIQGTDGTWYQPVPDPTAGEWIPVPRTGSPWHPDATFTNDAASALAARKAHRFAIQAIKTDLDQVESALTNISWSAVVWTNVTPAAFSAGAQRTTITALKNNGQQIEQNGRAMQSAVRNLRQAVEKIRREIR